MSHRIYSYLSKNFTKLEIFISQPSTFGKFSVVLTKLSKTHIFQVHFNLTLKFTVLSVIQRKSQDQDEFNHTQRGNLPRKDSGCIETSHAIYLSFPNFYPYKQLVFCDFHYQSWDLYLQNCYCSQWFLFFPSSDTWKKPKGKKILQNWISKNAQSQPITKVVSVLITQ